MSRRRETMDSVPGATARPSDLADVYGGLETGEGSLLLMTWAESPRTRLRAMRSYVRPALLTALLGYGVLFTVSALTLPTFAADPGDPEHRLLLPFLADVNVTFMFLVTLPVIMTLLLTERAVIPACLASIAREGVLETRLDRASELCRAWRDRYRTVNRVGQAIGLVVGVLVAVVNYLDFTKGGTCWQSTGPDVYLSGWLFVLVYVPFFYWVATQYLVRSIATICMLRNVVAVSRLHLNPFHEDRCGGLKAIGRLGLRNQYFLLVGGISVALIFYVMGKLGGGGDWLAYLLAAAAAGYLIVGPLFFLGPLLPFRASMRRVKRKEERRIARRLRTEYLSIMGKVKTADPDDLDQSTLTGLIELRDFVRRMPVWPFDVATLRRFLAAYAFPLVLFLVGIVANVAVGLLQSWFEGVAL